MPQCWEMRSVLPSGSLNHATLAPPGDKQISPKRTSALRSVSFSGAIDPRMGTATTLSNTLFGRTRGAVLAVLFGHVGDPYYLRHLARVTGIALGPVQRELRQLVDAGLVKKHSGR